MTNILFIFFRALFFLHFYSSLFLPLIDLRLLVHTYLRSRFYFVLLKILYASEISQGSLSCCKYENLISSVFSTSIFRSIGWCSGGDSWFCHLSDRIDGLAEGQKTTSRTARWHRPRGRTVILAPRRDLWDVSKRLYKFGNIAFILDFWLCVLQFPCDRY